MDHVSRFLKFFDIYSAPINFNFQMKKGFKTWLGGAMSVFIVCLMLIIVPFLSYDLFTKTNQEILVVPYSLKIPQTLNIDSSHYYPSNLNQNGYFFFFLIFKNKTNHQTIPKDIIENFFYIEIMINKKVISSQKIESSPLNYIICKQKNLQNFPFILPEMNEGICLTQTSFTLEGEYNSEIYKYLSIKIKNCNETKNAQQLKTCKENTIPILSSIQVQLYYLDFELDMSIHGKEKPFNFFPSFIDVSPLSSFYLKHDIYLSRHVFSSEESIIGNSEKYDFSIIARSKVDQMISPKGSSYISFFLRSEFSYNIYYRKYKGFVELLSQCGGIWCFLFYLVGIFIYKINSRLIQLNIANKTFNLIDPNKDISKESYKVLKKKDNRVDYYKKLVKFNNKSKLECSVSIDYYKYDRIKGIHSNMGDISCSLLCYWCKSDKMQVKNKILKMCYNLVSEDLDVSKIWVFSKQLKLIRRLTLGNLSQIIGGGYKKAIFSKKILTIKELVSQEIAQEDQTNLEKALEKEYLFINGIRGLKSKPVIDEKIDTRLLRIFDFNQKFMETYFINHYHVFQRVLEMPEICEENFLN